MVVVPFLDEDPRLVVRTVEIAASHPRVRQVIGIHGDNQEVAAEVGAAAPGIAIAAQERLGDLRPGKGDAINTGIARFLESDCDRLHFYDADIKTFDRSWIDQSEEGLDRGFATVRHFYPRAATDGMVTAMVVRPGLAMSWPDSVLARIRQPLSGEVAFTRAAASALAEESAVRRQSDWGIDTVITGVSAQLGLSIYENEIAEGKDHRLYGSLEDLEAMLWECLQAVRDLRRGPLPRRVRHQVVTRPDIAPAVRELVAFDFSVSERILRRPLSTTQRELLHEHFPSEVAASIEDRRWDCFDTHTWIGIVNLLITRADRESHDWQSIAFRLWVSRVLFYASVVVPEGYQQAMQYIEEMVSVAMLHPVN
jgi:mannosylglycerate synthase